MAAIVAAAVAIGVTTSVAVATLGVVPACVGVWYILLPPLTPFISLADGIVGVVIVEEGVGDGGGIDALLDVGRGRPWEGGV